MEELMPSYNSFAKATSANINANDDQFVTSINDINDQFLVGVLYPG
jgi:hypothetical protein